ncbi:MAG TPA: IS200/IS605 family transposase [Caldithrix abyssi]|uniref:IS200/IS605 family transposase n=1 Tax=Caldithrix abyssi TaxID=187145 RepID=A0A7V4WVA3_CALAY|nr:IS200/IS605 family transposase [Caldithrix abyssi]
MSKRTYTACYAHLVWGTKDRVPLLKSPESRAATTRYIREYAEEKAIPVKALYVNPDHVHLLIELPTNQTIEEIVKLVKGSSSHWINQNDIIKPKFAWAVGYAAFTVSKLNVGKVKHYIEKQEEHHRKSTFTEEYQKFIKEVENR